MWSGTAYSLILMSVYLSSANDVLSCQPPRLCTSSLDSATETEIITSFSCNQTNVWTVWLWKTDYYCTIRSVHMKYRCFSISSEEIAGSFEYAINIENSEGLGTHSWNLNTSAVIAECEVVGYFVTLIDDCHELLPSRNTTCVSNSVQPPISTEIKTSAEQKISTQTLNLMPTSIVKNTFPPADQLSVQPSISTEIKTSAEQKISTQTLNLMPTSIVKKTFPPADQLSGDQQIIAIIVSCCVLVLVILMAIVIVLTQKRCKYKKTHCDDNFDVFEPEYFPVIPDERVTFGDDISLKSNIQPLEMTKDKRLTVLQKHLFTAKSCEVGVECGGGECNITAQTEPLGKSVFQWFPSAQEC